MGFLFLNKSKTNNRQPNKTIQMSLTMLNLMFNFYFVKGMLFSVNCFSI
jgi:hypothetical protein